MWKRREETRKCTQCDLKRAEMVMTLLNCTVLHDHTLQYAEQTLSRTTAYHTLVLYDTNYTPLSCPTR